jgi:Mor family transcriptional regulator
MSTREYPELLSDLKEQLLSSLTDDGIKADVANTVATRATERIRKHWGGTLLYIPRGDGFELQARDLEIYRKFKGGNYIELAREYDLSEMRIRIIVKTIRAQERERRQVKMFPDR